MKTITLLLIALLISVNTSWGKGKANRTLERKLAAIGQSITSEKEIQVEISFLVSETGEIILLNWKCSDETHSDTLKEKVIKSQKNSKLKEGRYTHRIVFKRE
ncbi:MAG: hypothetical protein ACK4K0_10735 [Flavobacteriales bacterium]